MGFGWNGDGSGGLEGVSYLEDWMEGHMTEKIAGVLFFYLGRGSGCWIGVVLFDGIGALIDVRGFLFDAGGFLLDAERFLFDAECFLFDDAFSFGR